MDWLSLWIDSFDLPIIHSPYCLQWFSSNNALRYFQVRHHQCELLCLYSVRLILAIQEQEQYLTIIFHIPDDECHLLHHILKQFFTLAFCISTGATNPIDSFINLQFVISPYIISSCQDTETILMNKSNPAYSRNYIHRNAIQDHDCDKTDHCWVDWWECFSDKIIWFLFQVWKVNNVLCRIGSGH